MVQERCGTFRRSRHHVIDRNNAAISTVAKFEYVSETA
jgi:hypothetical protein